MLAAIWGTTYYCYGVTRSNLLPWQENVVSDVDELQSEHHQGHGAVYRDLQILFGVLQIASNKTSLRNSLVVLARLCFLG